MMQSYLGIITSHGLESLFLESDYALRFLARFTYTPQPLRGVRYWPLATWLDGRAEGGE